MLPAYGPHLGPQLIDHPQPALGLDQIDDALHSALTRQAPHPDDRLTFQIHRAAAEGEGGSDDERKTNDGIGDFTCILHRVRDTGTRHIKSDA